jgi:hypothetical protein
MKYILSIILLAMSTFATAEQSTDTLTQEAAAKAKLLGMQLKQQLGKAMKAGGPQAGIEVCHNVAESIAASLSADGWTVGRTSLKNRSLKNAPDAWESEVLMDFDNRHQSAPEEKLTATTMEQNAQGQKTFRFMAAIPTAEVCTTCHGVNISAEVVDLLHQYYPADLAKGYSVGDIRGAFTLSKVME